MRLFFALIVAAAACATAKPIPSSMPAPDPDEALQTNDILSRDAQTNHTMVKHILISWKDLSSSFEGHQTPKAAARTHEEANALAQDLYKRIKGGEPIEPLMAQYSDDEGSANTGKAYDVAPDANLVFEFKHLGLRLNVGEVGLVKSSYGWHVIQRVK
jgi:hypothetical protein